jgi:microcystin-dependent protein
MGLETGTYISDLVQTNPAVSDQESQGANHLQLIKKVLQNTFPGASLAFQFPTTQAISTNTSALVTDQNKTFLATTTGGAVTLTMPTLTSANAGWECSLIKLTTDINPVFVAPPTGTIQSGEIAGLAKARRCIPGARTRIVWTGAAWIAERVPRVPVGSIIDYSGSTLPVGYEWPNGQTLSSSANYPEIQSVWGALVTPDIRGRFTAGVDNMGGSAANRITSGGSGISGVTLGASGGTETLTIAKANLPAYNLDLSSLTASQAAHSHTVPSANAGAGNSPSVVAASATGTTNNNPGTSSSQPAITIGGTVPLGGSGTALASMNPTIVLNKILVTE